MMGYSGDMTKSAKLRVNFTAEEKKSIEARAKAESRSVASVIRLATLAYLKEGSA